MLTVNCPGALPTARIETPTQGSTITGTVTVAGWAVDNASAVGTAISSVQVKVDGVTVGTATYGSIRTDVCNAYPSRPGSPDVGYSFALNTSSLPPGSHTIPVAATDTDSIPQVVSYSATVTDSGSSSPPPTVWIETPTQGSTITGTVTVAGWAIDNASSVG